MADRNTKKLALKILQEDLDSFAGLDGIKDFAPSNAAFSSLNGADVKSVMLAAQTKAVQDEATAKASRDKAVNAEWQFHDYIRNARTHVKAQYGENSDQVQAVGLKKKSEYKSPSKTIGKPTNP
jgi:hypothetical protein